MSSFFVEMLRSEAKWFPRFLGLCKEKLKRLKLKGGNNILIFILTQILTCCSYRQVVSIIGRYHWTTRQAIYELRSRARIHAFRRGYVKAKERITFTIPDNEYQYGDGTMQGI